MRIKEQYATFQKPSWAPPSWVFGPVWTFLYIIIAISFGRVGYLLAGGEVPGIIAIPFVLNLIFNIAYTPIQFRLRNFSLAFLDILLVLGTLTWALIAIFPYESWVSYANIPYFSWVTFAAILQGTITYRNRRRE